MTSRSILLVVVYVTIVMFVSAGVIILQRSIDPFNGGSQNSYSSSRAENAPSTISTSSVGGVYPTTKTITLFSTVTSSIQQEYSVYVTLENTTISGSSTRVNHTVTVTEYSTVQTTQIYVATRTLTTTTNKTTTIKMRDNSTTTK